MDAVVKRHWSLRTAASAAMASLLVVSAVSPASAREAAPDTTPPVVGDIGITGGQVIPGLLTFRPTASDNVGVYLGCLT